MFRLAHISDIHLGPLPKVARRELFSKRITGYVNFRRNRSSPQHGSVTANLTAYLKQLDHDHTVITGDLINLGLPMEIQNAADWLKSLGSCEDHTVVLGNHDAYVRGARDRAMEAWQPWIKGDDNTPVKSDLDYPVVRRREKISIIACNSARASAPFLATGYFKRKQAEKLEHLIRKEQEMRQCCVVIIHHPPIQGSTPRHKRLIGAKHFKRVVKETGPNLVLHGHTHLETLQYLEGKNSDVPVLCVPAAYQWFGHKKPPASINLLTFSESNNTWLINLERHKLTEDGRFKPSEKLTISR